MTPALTLDEHPATNRVESIDLLRGLTILLMLWVNDLASVSGTPSALRHISPAGADGMTLVDVVFPAFLFIVGLSLPIALERRMAEGRSISVVAHIGLRVLGLLIIGVYMVNSESMPSNSPVYRACWSLLVYLGVILVWSAPSQPRPSRTTWIAGRWIGIMILVGAAFWYRNPEVGGWIQLRHSWWGILGLIGWAYLVTALVWLGLRRNLAAQVGMIGVLYCIYFADRAGMFTCVAWLDRVVDIGSMLGSLPAITLSGAVAGQMLVLSPDRPGHWQKIFGAFAFGLVLAGTGLLLHGLRQIHPMFIINKIAATPPWCLLSSALTLWAWALLHLLTDAVGLGGRPRILADAGRNALFAFVAAPVIYAVVDLVSGLTGGWDPYFHLSQNFATGVWRSLIFALAVTWLTGWLPRRGWTLRL